MISFSMKPIGPHLQVGVKSMEKSHKKKGPEKEPEVEDNFTTIRIAKDLKKRLDVMQDRMRFRSNSETVAWAFDNLKSPREQIENKFIELEHMVSILHKDNPKLAYLVYLEGEAFRVALKKPEYQQELEEMLDKFMTPQDMAQVDQGNLSDVSA